LPNALFHFSVWGTSVLFFGSVAVMDTQIEGDLGLLSAISWWVVLALAVGLIIKVSPSVTID